MAASNAGSASVRSSEGGDCPDIRLLLSVFVDGEATNEEAVRLKSHLALCEHCASHLAFLRLTHQALRQPPEAFPSASLSARIAAATYDRPTLSERIHGWLRPVPVRVALGTALAAGIGLVLVLPRIGGIAPEPLVSRPVAPKKEAPVAKGIRSRPAPRAAAPSVSEPLSVKPETNTALASAKTAAPKPTKLPVSPPVRTNPIIVAKASAGGGLLSLPLDRSSAAIDAVLRTARAEPRMDRNINRRSAASNIALKSPGAGSAAPLPPRSGYDRAASTALKLRPPVSTAMSVAPSVAPIVPAETAAVPSSSAGSIATERTAAPRLPGTSVASAVAEPLPMAAEGGKFQIRIKRSRGQNNALVFSARGQNGVGGLLSANGAGLGLGVGQGASTTLVRAPVTGID
ncbi:MAG: zf-HC2 domain-containing protein [Cytophagales bacterium]|nr:zf-HC2 domain-containing protein [Armatimonadota bacterium]